ncbi:MAG: hypothetical protein KKB50_06195 [Planctomycetes bacterium]|nr:hypothetical protein [Planctomycetota bacterium]
MPKSILRTCVLAGVICFALVGSALAEQVRFDNHRVVQVRVADEAQRDLALSLTDDLWTENARAGTLDLRLTPVQFAKLAESGLDYTVLVENLQALIDAERRGIGRGTWDAYMNYAGVLDYLDTLVALRPDLASLFVIGQTIEGRDIVGIRITGAGTHTKPGIYYESCIHAREWITVPTLLYFADQLVRNYDTDQQVHQMVDRCEWFIVPVLNADGYVYTWTNNRLWRKNRRDNPGTSCDGVDLNRNWSVGWGGGGSSGDPCDQTYRGTSAFSEPETAVVRDFVLAHPNIVTFHDIHSYSQLLLWPWGYTSQLPPDQDTYEYVGDNMVSLIRKVHGKIYTPGPIYSTIYQASGGSVDWAYGAAGVLSFTFELRPSSGTPGGFVLPPEEILPTAEEIYPALMFQADYTSALVWIDFPEGLPLHVEPDGSSTLDISITPGFDTVDVNNVTLYVRTVSGGEFDAVPVTHVGGDQFTVNFPPRGCGDDTEFYVVAGTTSGGLTYSPTGAPDDVYSTPVGTALVLFSDDMEADFGWDIDVAGDDDATTGMWNRMDPQGTAAQPEDDHSPSGTMCWVTDGNAGGSLGSYDVDNGKTSLFSPVFDFTQYPDATVSYWRWYSNDQGGTANEDVFEVLITNYGSAWVPLETVGPAGDETGGGWYFREFRVSDFLTPTQFVRFQFVASDEGSGSIVEAALDDFRVQAYVCEGLAGDVNCDGAINGFDIDAFVLVLGATPPGFQEYYDVYPLCDHMRADCNGDGEVNGFDIDSFVLLLAK